MFDLINALTYLLAHRHALCHRSSLALSQTFVSALCLKKCSHNVIDYSIDKVQSRDERECLFQSHSLPFPTVHSHSKSQSHCRSLLHGAPFRIIICPSGRGLPRRFVPFVTPNRQHLFYQPNVWHSAYDNKTVHPQIQLMAAIMSLYAVRSLYGGRRMFRGEDFKVAENR